MLRVIAVGATILFAANVAAAQSFGDGTHIIGSDIQPGTYRAPGGDFCLRERVSGFSGSFSDLLAGEVPTGATVVTIQDTDAGFKTAGCGVWERIGGSDHGIFSAEIVGAVVLSIVAGVGEAVKPDAALVDLIEAEATNYANAISEHMRDYPRTMILGIVDTFIQELKGR